ncbi:ATP-binding protein [Polynucleobacter sp. IMCC30063]|uniref:sensor histidine kinase n=1 Tax=Polynucleobacter sp. IMCC30063 TaxID=2907298 RepID=UPI001F1B7A66|nr:ATP-binding protein [Polynucleobacter sp. IMCC30063]MCE7504869.1 ATP-binding protein [Polynucleobacter sp. IMCC30063]
MISSPIPARWSAALAREGWKRRALPIAVTASGFLALVLLILLSVASSNTAFFDNNFIWLYSANVVVGLCLLTIILVLGAVIAVRWKERRFGARLVAKLAMIFALVGVVPGLILYGVSWQFVSRSIETWFDVKVETALGAALELGRTTLDASLQELQDDGSNIAEQLTRLPNNASAAELTLILSRLRAQTNTQELAIFNTRQQLIAIAISGSNIQEAPPPSASLLAQANKLKGTGTIDERIEGDGSQSYFLRAVVPISQGRVTSAAGNFGISPQGLREARYLQLVKQVPPSVTKNTLAIQTAYSDYQEKALGRTGLRKMYIGTLTLTLFFALFVAVSLALLLGGELAKPLLMLLRGTEAVAQGDLSPKPELDTGDELGMLTRQFNMMTKQIADARTAQEESKSFLQSILDSLTAGVCIFDQQYRLVSSNPGADRIFGTELAPMRGQQINAFPLLGEFDAAIREGFATLHMAISGEASQANHKKPSATIWQKQIQLHAINEYENEVGVTLFVRGTELSHELRLIVFDDITDVVTAQRSIAWGEVARRLAHEIKNPLTPIQLSAERLQQKLTGAVTPELEEMMKRNTATIIGQVQAMKQMVNEFRDFAKTPLPQLRPVSLNALIQEILGLYEGSPMEVQLDPKCPDILGDPTQLRQVIHNLLQNAQDATLEGKDHTALVEVRTSVVPYGIGAHPQQNAVRLTISDSGCGFPAKILARAFEPYVTTKSKGTGLGLAVVKKIIDDHGAKIEIQNRLQGEILIGAKVAIVFMNLAKEPA